MVRRRFRPWYEQLQAIRQPESRNADPAGDLPRAALAPVGSLPLATGGVDWAL
jgi:hypothetical protein